MTVNELITALQKQPGSEQARLPFTIITCSYCGRVYDKALGEITLDEVDSVQNGGPCPSDDCPGHD